jgi:hypothetical protein
MACKVAISVVFKGLTNFMGTPLSVSFVPTIKGREQDTTNPSESVTELLVRYLVSAELLSEGIFL